MMLGTVFQMRDWIFENQNIYDFSHLIFFILSENWQGLDRIRSFIKSKIFKMHKNLYDPLPIIINHKNCTAISNIKTLKISTTYRIVSSVVWQIFYEFLIFSNFFHEPLCMWNNNEIWETSIIFVYIVRGYCATTTLAVFVLRLLKCDRMFKWQVLC